MYPRVNGPCLNPSHLSAKQLAGIPQKSQTKPLTAKPRPPHDLAHFGMSKNMSGIVVANKFIDSFYTSETCYVRTHRRKLPRTVNHVLRKYPLSRQKRAQSNQQVFVRPVKCPIVTNPLCGGERLRLNYRRESFILNGPFVGRLRDDLGMEPTDGPTQNCLPHVFWVCKNFHDMFVAPRRLFPWVLNVPTIKFSGYRFRSFLRVNAKTIYFTHDRHFSDRPMNENYPRIVNVLPFFQQPLRLALLRKEHAAKSVTSRTASSEP